MSQLTSKVQHGRILSKVDTKAKWLEHDPVLLENEVAYEKESGKYKIGDGKTKWSLLPFAVSGEGSGSTGSGVGSATLQGGEIFNDYENNQATGLNSHASGSNTVAALGLKFSDQELVYESYTPENNTLALTASNNFFETNEDNLYGFRINNIGAKPNDRNYINIVKILDKQNNEGVWSFVIEPVTSEMTLNIPNGLVIHAILYDETVVTTSQHAEGADTLALGDAAHAENKENVAYGDYSHAEGWGTVAGGIKSGKIRGKAGHAEGYNTWAKENYSHAEGAHTIASGSVAHAEGQGTIASGNISHAEGANTQAIGAQSHAEGKGTIAHTNYSHAEGLDSEAEGLSSHAEGYNTYTEGEGAHAEGYNSQALGNASHAEGHTNYAYGNYSHAEGNQSQAHGAYSHTEGQGTQTTETALYAHVEGQGTVANIAGQHVSGKYNKYEDADKNPLNYACVVGNGNAGTRSNAYTLDWEGNAEFAGTVEAKAIEAEGVEVTNNLQVDGKITTVNLNATGNITKNGANVALASELIGKHYEGDQQGGETFNDYGTNKASGQFSHAEGTGTQALSTTSHAEGWGSIAEGNTSHAEGRSTHAKGMRSHSEGYQTKAWADHTHAEGEGTYANIKGEHVQGKYNKYLDENNKPLNYAHVVGNGSSDTARSNAHTLDWNGNAWFAGKIDGQGFTINGQPLRSIAHSDTEPDESADIWLKNCIVGNRQIVDFHFHNFPNGGSALGDITLQLYEGDPTNFDELIVNHYNDGIIVYNTSNILKQIHLPSSIEQYLFLSPNEPVYYNYHSNNNTVLFTFEYGDDAGDGTHTWLNESDFQDIIGQTAYFGVLASGSGSCQQRMLVRNYNYEKYLNTTQVQDKWLTNFTNEEFGLLFSKLNNL